jgi:hypothetical protein
MTQIVPVDVARFSLDLHRDLSVSLRARKPGPPERIDGATIGFVSVTGEAPHGGEVTTVRCECALAIQGRPKDGARSVLPQDLHTNFPAFDAPRPHPLPARGSKRSPPSNPPSTR